MARRPRLDMAGFHHIINRGVAKYKVYRCNEYKEKFFLSRAKAPALARIFLVPNVLIWNSYRS